MSVSTVRVILNPAASGGAALDLVEPIGRALSSFDLTHEIVLTRSPGHGTELARAAIADGVEVLAVAGGDGTLAEVLAAFVDDGGHPIAGPDLALIATGTPGDFARTLGLRGSISEAVARLRHGTRRRIDLGVVQVRISEDADAPITRPFVSAVSVGLAGEALSRLNELASPGTDARRYGTRFLGPRGKMLLGAARALMDQRTVGVRVRVDGRDVFEGNAVGVTIANGRYCAGGLMMAPHADPGDGRLEVVIVGDVRLLDLTRLLPKALRGAHLSEAGISVAHGARVEIESRMPWAKVLADVDGTQLGRLPLTAELRPGALTFRV